jgi:hypothetical protein
MGDEVAYNGQKVLMLTQIELRKACVHHAI